MEDNTCLGLGRKVIQHEYPGVPAVHSLKSLLWQHRGQRGQARSHVGIIRSSAAFRWNPDDILIGILDVAGLAVDAILRIDLQPSS